MSKFKAGNCALYSADAIRQMDAKQIASGTDGYVLMRRAAHSAFRLVRKRWPRAKRLVVLCGPGNNGGDGYVIAELAKRSGREVTLFSLATPKTPSAINAAADAASVEVNAQDFNEAAMCNADLIIDAIYGTGLNREPDAKAAMFITSANAQVAPCLAVDIPSGLQADTGHTLGTAIVADATISFIAAKLGMYTGNGPACCGEITLDTLEVAHQHIASQQPLAYRLNAAQIQAMLPNRNASAHKGTAGHVVVIGGNQGMSGAVRLAAEAALRTGAGLVSVACHPACASAVSSGRPELMVRAIANSQDLDPLLQKATTIVLGPGLGQDNWAKSIYKAVLAHQHPTVIDADALNLLAQTPQRCPNTVLTPHPAEAARLLKSNTNTVQSNRPLAVQQLANKYQATVVLKGPGSLVATENEALYLCDRGNAGMASGGMGDLLTGVIAALLAAGSAAHQAAASGTWLHSAAADKAARDGQTGLIASDLLPALRQLRDRPTE